MTDTAPTPPSHEILTAYRWCYAEGDGVYYSVESYDPAAGTVALQPADDCGYNPEDWHLKGGAWVNQHLCHEVPGDVTETEFTGAARCMECGHMFRADYPSEDYCGCRH